MKKLFVIAVALCGMMTAQAQQALQGTDWSIGVDGGATTPLTNHAFFGDMRGAFGLHIQKQLTPTFALGVEGVAAVNTSSWAHVPELKSSTMIDDSYVGAYTSINLFNLFGGYKCGGRLFDIDVVAGAGWGHVYNSFNRPEGVTDQVWIEEGMREAVNAHNDWNYFATKVGVNFNFNVNRHLTISIKPSIVWDLSDTHGEQTTAMYNVNAARVNLFAGLSYHFGGGFQCVSPKNQAEIDALNARINQLRGELDACAAASAALDARIAGLEAELAACKNRKPEVIKEVSNNLNSVRYVFFKFGQATITADQRPNVEMIADYLKAHKDANVVVKGYASKDGNLDFNIKLAQRRAEAVKTMLVKKFGIAADRITAEGEGIGEMFSEQSWNRVAICTVDEK